LYFCQSGVFSFFYVIEKVDYKKQPDADTVVMRKIKFQKQLAAATITQIV